MIRNVRPPSSDFPPVPVAYHTDKDEWELLRDYSVFDPRKNVILTALRGFPFDLASIPRILWLGSAPFELSIVGPLFHDALYRHGGKSGRYLHLTPPTSYNRRDADKLFGEHMKAERVRWWRRAPAYRAVRWFGEGSWKETNDEQ